MFLVFQRVINLLHYFRGRLPQLIGIIAHGEISAIHMVSSCSLNTVKPLVSRLHGIKIDDMGRLLCRNYKRILDLRGCYGLRVTNICHVVDLDGTILGGVCVLSSQNQLIRLLYGWPFSLISFAFITHTRHVKIDLSLIRVHRVVEDHWFSCFVHEHHRCIFIIFRELKVLR